MRHKQTRWEFTWILVFSKSLEYHHAYHYEQNKCNDNGAQWSISCAMLPLSVIMMVRSKFLSQNITQGGHIYLMILNSIYWIVICHATLPVDIYTPVLEFILSLKSQVNVGSIWLPPQRDSDIHVWLDLAYVLCTMFLT